MQLFGPRWNPNIPRFAANLGFAPLEPVKAGTDLQQGTAISGKTGQSFTASEVSNAKIIKYHNLMKLKRKMINFQKFQEVPAAQFDWNSAGLVNPLDASEYFASLNRIFFCKPKKHR